MLMRNVVLMVGIKHAENNVQLLGSCFALPKPGYYVTCRHVIGNFENNLVLVMPQFTEVNDYQDTSRTSCQSMPVQTVEAINPLCDLAILKAQPIAEDIFPLSSLDEMVQGDEVDIMGYPHCVTDWQMHILTLQETMVGAKVLRESQSLKFKYAILNVQTRPGQSGSLVFSRRLNRIVGILVGGYALDSGIRLGGINPYELNQTSFCLSAEYINEMLKE